MKTKIKRHSRSVLSVILAISMLISCMMVGLIATDAAKVDGESVGGSDSTITDYRFKGAFDSWTEHYVNSEGKAFIDINTAGTYDFVVVTGGGTQRRANKTFTKTESYNTSQDEANFKIEVTTPGTYTFQTSLKDSGGSVKVSLTFPSGGSTTSTDWRLVDGDCNWTAANSTKKFTLNSSTGYYEYSQYFTGDNYFRVYDGTSQYNGNGGSSDVTLTAGADFVNLGNATTSKSFKFTPATAGTYIVQIDAANKKIKIQAATKYSITCQTPTNGALSSSMSTASAGESVTVTATPNSGYSLKSLVLNYDDTDHDVTSSMVGNTYTFNMPAYNVTAKATYTNARTIYFNNYVSQWSKVYVYTKNAGGEEGNGSAPGVEMTRVGTSSIYSAEVPADTTYIVFSGSGGATNEGATITYKTNTNYGNGLPSDYSEYKATNADGSTGEWSAHSGRDNVYTVTAGTSVTGNSNLYYSGINATLYDYYTDGEVNNGWIDGIKDYNSSTNTLAEYSLSNGSQYTWVPYRTLNDALADYAAEKSITYPLYFGNMNITNSSSVGQNNIEYYSGSTTNKLTNWYYKVNNATLLSPNTSSITGLANSSEGNSTINHSSGAAMAMFDEDWLSQENSKGKPLATILHSSAFPVRKVTAAAKTTYPNKIYVSAGDFAPASGGELWVRFLDASDNYSDVELTLNGSYYECEIPTDRTYTKAIIVRQPSTNHSNIDWKNYWNESVRLDLPSSNTDANRKYTFNAWGNDGKKGSTFNRSNIEASYGTTDPGGYTYYEYDSTDGKDNAYIQNVSTSAHTATIEYSNSSKVSSCGGNEGFYPFDNLTGDKTYNHVNGTAHDLGYGMKVEIPFSLNANGTVDGTANGIAQTFNFSGDDDLWVYIDGHLVLDLGGAHLKAEGSINFKDLIATSTTKVVDAATAAASADSDTLTATGTYSNDFSSWFDTNSEALHTMTLYYMERGMYDSNLKFDFSFHAIQNLYKTEKKVRTNSINSGFYVKSSETIDTPSGMTKFEKSYQDEVFNFDHKVSSDNTTFAYPANSFSYAKVSGGTTSTENYTTGSPLSYGLMNDDVAQFNGKFTTGDYFRLAETADSSNKYNYTPKLTVYDDNDKTRKTTYPVTSVGTGAYTFQFDQPDATGLKTVNVRAQFENEMKQHDLKIYKSIGDKTDTSTEFVFRITFNFDYETSGDNGYEGYPLYISSDKDSSKTQLDSIQIGSSSALSIGYFKIKAGETITIPKIPEGAEFKIEEIFDELETSGTNYSDGITNYTYGGMSAIGATATNVAGSNAVTMTMGASDISVTAKNNDNTVKATIRVKYAPSYYDFEQGTNINTDTYKLESGLTRTNVSTHVDCTTDFTDSTSQSKVINENTYVETAVRNASDSFNVKVDHVSAGGMLFIGWYDESGNRYNDTDATQHSFTASATKAEDRIFEARFITAPTYRIDFAVPTRLWGNRIYKVFGKVSNSLINQGFIGYDSTRETTAEVEKRYYLTGDLVTDRVPNETVFLKTIDWPNIDDGTTSTQYNVTKTVTQNTGTVTDVEETSTGTNKYNLYRYVAASMTDQKVTVQIFSDCSDTETVQVIQTVNYGESINNNATVATNIPSDKTFWRWKIETLNSLGGTANGTLVTYDYSPNFNYVAYDNYKVTVELLDKEAGGTEYSPVASQIEGNPYYNNRPTNTSSVVILGQTRSHWNDTVSGAAYIPQEGESDKHTNANNDVDRLFIDLALSYSDGSETKLNTVDKQVGFIIEYQKTDGTWEKFKEVGFSSKKLGDKNRIEYFYDFKNAAGNRNAKFKVTPTIEGAKSGNGVEFNFSADRFSAQTN